MIDILTNSINSQQIKFIFTQFLSINKQYRLKIIQQFKKLIQINKKQYKQTIQKQNIYSKPLCFCQYQNKKNSIIQQKKNLKLQNFKDLYNYYNISIFDTPDLSLLKKYSNQLFKNQENDIQFSYTPLISTISMEEYEERLNYLGSQIHTKNLSIEKILNDLETIEQKLMNQDFIYGIQEEELENYERIAKGDIQNEKLINIIRILIKRFLRNRHEKRNSVQIQVNIKESNVIKQLEVQKKQLKYEASKLKTQITVLEESLLLKDRQLKSLVHKNQVQEKQFNQKQSDFKNKIYEKEQEIVQVNRKFQNLNEQSQNLKHKVFILAKINQQIKENNNIKSSKEGNILKKKNNNQKESNNNNRLLRSSVRKQKIYGEQQRQENMNDLEAKNNNLNEMKQNEEKISDIQNIKSMGTIDNITKNQKKGFNYHAMSINNINQETQEIRQQDEINYMRSMNRKKSNFKFKMLNSKNINKRFVDSIALTNQSNIAKDTSNSIQNDHNHEKIVKNYDNSSQIKNCLLQKLYSIEINSQICIIKANYQEFVTFYHQMIKKLSRQNFKKELNQIQKFGQRIQAKNSTKLFDSIKDKSKSKDKSRNKLFSSQKQKEQFIQNKEKIYSKFYKNKGSSSYNNEKQKIEYKSTNISRQQTQKNQNYFIQKSKKYGYRQIKQAIKNSLLNSINQEENKSFEPGYHQNYSCQMENQQKKSRLYQLNDVQEQLKLLAELFFYHKNNKNIKIQQKKENIVLKPKENQYILEILSYLAYLHANFQQKYNKIIKIINKNQFVLKNKQEENQELKLIFYNMVVAHRNCNNSLSNKLCAHLQRFTSQICKIIQNDKNKLILNEQQQNDQDEDVNEFDSLILKSKNLLQKTVKEKNAVCND